VGSSLPSNRSLPGIVRDLTRRVDALSAQTVRPEAAQSTYERLSRGIIAQQVLIANSSAWSTDADTDMLLSNVSVVGGRTYGVHLHTQVLFGSLAVAATWTVNLKLNGTVIDRFAVFQPNIGGNSRWTIDSTLYWTPAATGDTDDLLVSVDEGIDGADLTFEAAATARRTLTLLDVALL
jgi:hypothetical protein